MNKFITFIPLLIYFNIGISQDYYSEFKQAFTSNDTTRQLEILKSWESDFPNDAELYTSYFNYYFVKAKSAIIVLSPDRPDGQSLELFDSLNQSSGFLGEKTIYANSYFNQGITKINKGIELYPDRLDMRFGKIYAYGQKEEWDDFTSEIIVAIQYSVKNRNQWTWTLNEKKADGEKFFLESLQNYQVQLYETGIDSLLLCMQAIAQEVLKYYPEHIESLSNLAISYLLNKNYKEAIEFLLKAEKINPTDYIVLSNIAYAYKLNGDTQKSIEYYNKVIKYGDEASVEMAKQQIQLMK